MQGAEKRFFAELRKLWRKILRGVRYRFPSATDLNSVNANRVKRSERARVKAVSALIWRIISPATSKTDIRLSVYLPLHTRLLNVRLKRCALNRTWMSALRLSNATIRALQASSNLTTNFLQNGRNFQAATFMSGGITPSSNRILLHIRLSIRWVMKCARTRSSA